MRTPLLYTLLDHAVRYNEGLRVVYSTPRMAANYTSLSDLADNRQGRSGAGVGSTQPLEVA